MASISHINQLLSGHLLTLEYLRNKEIEIDTGRIMQRVWEAKRSNGSPSPVRILERETKTAVLPRRSAN